MRVLVIGAEGQLGKDVLAELGPLVADAPPHADLDITDETRVSERISRIKPDVVINLSAFHDVPTCEKRPHTAFEVNTLGPRYVARACRANGAGFFHISTDYVFDGRKGEPYEEDDLTGPMMIYGATKLAGEYLALAEWEQTYILRTTGLFGSNPCRAKPGGRNFVETMLHLGRTRGKVDVVSDVFCCPTYSKDLARQLATLSTDPPAPGVYHVVSPPGCSWMEFARMIFSAAGLEEVKVTPVSSGASPALFRRPADSRLAIRKIGKSGRSVMRPLKEAIEDYMRRRD
ncbi:MAG: dTDP-4-dehydrorhamnose reductase [Deltaproteobacteria bacterium]|nr:dTDP-4-dehydrorhamnose reductase [Deltaproteobacteria bacterium]